jgi:hypothetical protein
MHDLAGVTFVQSVQSPALAMVTVLLILTILETILATINYDDDSPIFLKDLFIQQNCIKKFH